MSGLLTFSDDATWMVNNHLWRRLLDRAAEDPAAGATADTLTTARHVSGLAFPDLAPADRARAVAALATAATALVAAVRAESGPERAMDAAKLEELLPLLHREAGRPGA